MKGQLLVLFLVSAAIAGAQNGARRAAQGVRPEAMQPDIALVDPDPDFPLRVHLFNVRWGGLADRNHGYGTGNLIYPTHLQGFDFAFECEAPFTANAAPADAYQARLKKSPYQLEILTIDVAGKHVHTCNLHLAFEARPFTDKNRAHFDHGVSSSLRVPWTDPGFAYEVPDQDYPLQFHVIDGLRKEDSLGDHGYGTANLSAPGKDLQGVEYNYDCGRGFITSSQIDNYYEGRWTKPGQRIELLLQRPGSGKVDECTITVTLKPDPYPEPHRRSQEPVDRSVPAEVIRPVVVSSPPGDNF